MNDTNYSPFQMSISLNSLNHLGMNLYSNVPAVLSELVANAYDANAHVVRIEITEDTIIISDDGDGMTQNEINERYLTIGYSRRTHQPGLTRLGRQPMGRKGIGKLAVFSIADTIEVYSAKAGEANGLEMSRKAIQSIIEDSAEADRTYRPRALEIIDPPFEHGTKLVLRDLRRKRAANMAVEYLKRRLARRFTIIGARHDFRIFINEEEVTPRDRGYFESLEFIWFFGERDAEVLDGCSAVKRVETLSNVVIVDADNQYEINGWIGTVEEPSKLGDRSEEGNSIVIYARGKLVQENILQEFRESRLFAQYIVGDVEADFIDLDNEEDLATSDRQRLVADDPRYIKLKSRIEEAVKEIGSRWTELRRDEGSERALDNPVIKGWYERLNSDNRKHAKKLFGKIESLPIADRQSRGELYKASILAFEKMALTGHLLALDEINSNEGLEALLAIFQSVDDLEAVHYYEIAKGRLRVVQEFAGIVDEDAKEKVLQRYLFDHLWLLDAAWDRATNTARIEEQVEKEFGIVTASLTDEERKARIDIKYRTFAGKYVIVELKRRSVKIDVHQLTSQIDKYKTALKKVLENIGERSPQIEIVCVIGSSPAGSNPERSLAAIDARYVTYDELIYNAKISYKDYLERQKKISEISSILEELEKSFA